MDDRTIEIKLYWLKLRMKSYLKQMECDFKGEKNTSTNILTDDFTFGLMLMNLLKTNHHHSLLTPTQTPADDSIYCQEPHFVKWKNTPL